MTEEPPLPPLDHLAPVALAMFGHGDDGQPVIHQANALAAALLGQDPAELTDLTLTGLLPFEDLETLANAIEDAGDEPSNPLVLRWGRSLPVTFVGARIQRLASGDVMAALTDLTDQYRLDTMLCGAGSGVFIADVQRRVTWMSPMTEAVLGIPPETFIGQDFIGLVHPDDQPELLRATAELVSHPGVEVIRSYRLRHPLIADTWWRLRSSSTYLPDDPAIAGVASRIELTIQAEVEAGDRGAQMTLGEMSPSAMLMAAAGRMTFRNNLARQTLGPYAELDDPEGWVGALRVSHRDGVLNALRLARDEGRRSSALAALDRPGGATQWLRVEAAPAMDEDGHMVGYIATLLDVTTETETREQLQEAQARLWDLANHDQLTGLPNRMQFTDRLERALGNLRREHRPVAVLYCDLDLFKPVNDERGHPSGDQVLIEVARRLREAVRRTDTVCRFGGDEFVVICEAFASPTGIRELGERLIAAVHPPITVDGGEVRVSLSIGMAVADQLSTVEGLLAKADRALYQAKESGRDRLVEAD